MVKLKLNRDQLYTLCGFTNPAVHEKKVDSCIRANMYSALNELFNLIQIGEAVSKKYLFTVKAKYTISLKYAEAAALLSYTYKLGELLPTLSYEYNVMIILRQSLHQQLTNFQRRFYGQNITSSFLIGTDQGAGGEIKSIA